MRLSGTQIGAARHALVAAIALLIAIAILLLMQRGGSEASRSAEEPPSRPTNLPASVESKPAPMSRQAAPVSSSNFRGESVHRSITVVNERGDPVSDAAILVCKSRFREAPPEGSLYFGMTSHRGELTYDWSKWPEDLALLSIHHPRFIPEVVLRPTHATDLKIVLREGGKIVVRCVSEGRALAGVCVRASRVALSHVDRGNPAGGQSPITKGTEPSSGIHLGMTDVAGEATLEGLPEGKYLIGAWKHGYVVTQSSGSINVPTTDSVLIELESPIVFAIEYDGDDVIRTLISGSLRLSSIGSHECGALTRELNERFPNAYISVWPPGGAGRGAANISVVHRRGVNKFQVLGVPFPEFVKPQKERFNTTSEVPVSGSVEIEFVDPSGQVCEYTGYAVQYVIGSEYAGGMFGADAAALHTPLAPNSLTPGKYRVLPGLWVPQKLFRITEFDVKSGETTRVKISLAARVRGVRLSVDFEDKVLERTCGLSFKSGTTSGSPFGPGPILCWVTPATELTVEATAFGCLPTSLTVPVSDGPGVVEVPISMKWAP